MAKSPAHWEKPPSTKGAAANRGDDLKPGKSDLPTPRDMDWHKAAKESGVGFSGNPTAVLVRGDNPAAGEYRRPPEHRYNLTDFGAGTGPQRIEVQNKLAGKRK
jgi:hypothetical protein